MKEQWKKIPIEMLREYEVSSFGRIKSNKSNKLMTLLSWRSGHKYFGVWNSKKHFSISVSRMVLFAFVGKPKRKQECSHLNGNPSDNRLVNLRWETHAENMARTIKHGTSIAGEKDPNCKWGRKLMLKVKKMIDRGERPKQVSYITGVPLSTVYNLKCGVNWRCL